MNVIQAKLSYFIPETELDTGEQVKIRNLFILICLFHLLIWTVLPTIMIPNPPTDSLEGLAWGRLWLWGYPKHPFLAPWLTTLFTGFFHTVGWPIYLLAQLSCIGCFWGAWRLANQLLPPWQALIATMLLTTVQYYNISAYIFDPNVLMLPMWAWLAFYFHQAVTHQRFHFWMLTGLFAGLSLLSKYESGLLILLLFLLLFTTQQGRLSWKRPGVYAAAFLAILVFSPNLHYLYQHHFNAVNYALDEMAKPSVSVWQGLFLRFYRPFYFLITHLAYLLPWLVLFLPFYRHCSPNRLGSMNSFQRQLVLILGLGPLLFTVITATLVNAALVERWGFPFFCFTGILWVAWLNPNLNSSAQRLREIKIFLKIWLSIFTIMALAFTLITGLLPYFSQPSQGKVHSNFPGEEITRQVIQQWKNYSTKPLLYVAGDLQYVSNITAFAHTKTIPFFFSDINQSPWINLTEFKQAGGVFVYPIRNKHDQEIINAIKSQYPEINRELILEASLLTHAKLPKIKYWIGFLPPKVDAPPQ